MNSFNTAIDYKGARLSVEVDDLRAALRINGIVRETLKTDAPGKPTLRLSTSWQTDYEYHEYIEALVEFTAQSISVKIIANREVLREESFIPS